MHRLRAQELLKKFLNKLYLLYKKNIYYDGYNINKKIIEKNNIYPYNMEEDMISHKNNCSIINNYNNLIFY